jgi:hypothetical protein
MAGSRPLVVLYAFFVKHYVAAVTGAMKEQRAGLAARTERSAIRDCTPLEILMPDYAFAPSGLHELRRVAGRNCEAYFAVRPYPTDFPGRFG